MVVLVVLVSRHKLALKKFEESGISLLDKNSMPIDIANKVTLQPCIFDPSKASSVTFEAFIQQGGCYESASDRPMIDGIVVLYEEPLEYLLKNVRNAVFAARIPSIGYVENVHSFLSGHFKVLLGNYVHLMTLVSDATKRQAVSLPIRNFNAEELRLLIDICRASSLEKTFQNTINQCLSKLLKLRGPKRRSNYAHVYFKDGSGCYFSYGHERHARFETGGMHTNACAINGHFRLGWALEQGRHFNVTKGDSDTAERITCQLPNCHDEIVETKNRTHINMFSNDFH